METPDRHRDHALKKPLSELEARVVRLHLEHPHDVADDRVERLRYVLAFARLTWVRAQSGQDVYLGDRLGALRSRVTDEISARLAPGATHLGAAAGAVPELVRLVAKERARLRQDSVIDEVALVDEVAERNLVVVCGGGGGSGYGYPGAYTLLYRSGLEPKLVAGTSIGALIGLFRAKTRIFDLAPMLEATKRLAWSKAFRVLDVESRYGLPATLRFYLRSVVGEMFRRRDGEPMTIGDLEIPFLVVATGLTVGGLKHDLDYYEHFLDDVKSPGFRFSRWAKLGSIVGIVRELVSEPQALRQIVFGADPLTLTADAVDAVGFSSSVPGLIHYDVHRDDPRMKALLDQLYAEHGITRLIEGGLTNNVPVIPAYDEVLRGRLGRRGAFVLALDCFAPRPRDHVFFALQQVARANVKDNIPYADLYLPLEKRLSPALLVPDRDRITEAMDWTMDELRPHLPFIQRMCRPIEVPLAHTEAA
jgi:predicted acylesterase/phospholipase RssA